MQEISQLMGMPTRNSISVQMGLFGPEEEPATLSLALSESNPTSVLLSRSLIQDKSPSFCGSK